METVAGGYVRALQRAISNGQIAPRGPKELEAIVFILMGARYYLCMRFARREYQTVSLPEWVVRTYMEIVTSTLFQKKPK